MSPCTFLMGFAAENFITRSIVSLNLSNCTECTKAVVYFLKLSFYRGSYSKLNKVQVTIIEKRIYI